MKNNALSASAAAGQPAPSNQLAGSFYGNYVYGNTATTTTTSYTPSSVGMATLLSSGALSTQTVFGSWYPQSPVAAPAKGQVINWGGKVYYQPSDKMRALVDALRLL